MYFIHFDRRPRASGLVVFVPERMKKTAVVVIPIYRKFVPSEAFSFSQCLKVLSRYDISLLHPERLDLSDVLESTPPNVSEIVLPDS